MSARMLVVWYLVTAAGIMAVGGLLQRTPVWLAGAGRATALLALSLAYAAGGLAIAWHQARRGPVSPIEAIRTMLAAFGVVFFAVVMTEISFSRLTLVGVCGTAAVLTLAPFVLPQRATVAVAIATVVAALPSAVASAILGPPGPSVRESVVSTSLYTVGITVHPEAIPSDTIRGGGIAPFGDRFVVATGGGAIYLLDRRDDVIHVTPTALAVPINAAEFRAAASGPTVPTWMFRVTGLALLESGGDSVRVFVAHHLWRQADNCFVLRVSEAAGKRDAVFATGGAAWRTVFDTSPCLAFKSTGRLFNGAQSGGRILLMDSTTLLLSVGDHEFDGVNAGAALSQDSAASYGKTMAIDIATGRARVFTSGHRNPQGLAMTRDGTIWLTEHGPSGGDELNSLVSGGNYGWPYETYGTNYGAHFWPLSGKQGRHTRFQQPVHAWIPSIGISSVIEMGGDAFPLWDGDLLIGSLVGSTLYRVHVEAGRVVVAEPIAVGERVRDLARARDGAVVLWLDRGGIGVVEPARISAGDGARHFTALCGGCHMVMDGTAHGVGPDLDGLASRRVAAAKDYPYSDALRRLGGRWSAARLDRLLREGQAFAPGMAMPDLVVGDSATRAAIVAYLRTLH